MVAGAGIEHHSDLGVVGTPLDLTGISVLAWLPLPDGGFDSTAGVGYDGGLSVPGVPVGATYYLQVGTDFVVTSARSLDLVNATLGRADTFPPARFTTLTFDMTGLDAWATGDYLEVFSSNAGSLVVDFQDRSASGPAPGDTALDGTDVDYYVENANLIDASKGDQVWLTQLAGRQSDAGVAYQALAAFAERGDLTLVEGSDAEWDGGLSRAADAGAVEASVARSQFGSYRTQINPAAQHSRQALYVYALPDAESAGAYAVGPDLAQVQLTPATTDLDLGALAFLDPFPAAWSRLVEWDDNYSSSYQAPPAPALTVEGGFYQVAEAASLAGPIAPQVGPAQGVRINGLTLDTDRIGVGTTPVLSWSAPAVGANVQYQVGVNLLFAQNGVTNRVRVATFFTRDTTLAIPPGVLQGGQPYFIRLSSELTAVDRTVSPYRQALPQAVCDVLTGAFVP